MGRRYANILETVGNTPVVKINRLAPEASLDGAPGDGPVCRYCKRAVSE